MRKTMKTYFFVMQILNLIAAITFCIAPVVFLIAAIFGGFSPIPLPSVLGPIILAIPFIVFAILLFKASGKFKKARNKTDEELVKERKSLLGWGIFSAIMYSPSIVGLIVAIIFVVLINNTISEIEKGNYENVDKTLGERFKNGAKATVEGAKEIFGAKNEMQKQKEMLEELKNWKESGILTEEEYNAKRKQILGI